MTRLGLSGALGSTLVAAGLCLMASGGPVGSGLCAVGLIHLLHALWQSE